MAIQNVAVPNVVGETLAQATTDLTNAGLVGQTFGTPDPNATVWAQNPTATTVVPAGSSVTLTMTVAVPDVKTKTYNDAVNAITQVGLAVGQVTGSAGANAPVIAQNPAGPTEVPPGSSVDLDLEISVPDVTGQTLQNAEATLTGANLVVGALPANALPGSIVTGEAPAASTLVMPKRVIDLTLNAQVGFDSASFMNCLASQHVVSVFAKDVTTANWIDVGFGAPLPSSIDLHGNCGGATASTLQFAMNPGVTYRFVAVDRQLPNCPVGGFDNPDDPNCICWSSFALGVAGGGITDQTIQ